VPYIAGDGTSEDVPYIAGDGTSEDVPYNRTLRHV
jgi:hypothetical protein